MDLTQPIIEGHGYLGYIVAAAVLGSLVRAAVARSRGEAYSSGAARLAGLLLALQFVYGLVVYGAGGYWDAGPLVAYVHPLAMFAAVGVAGAATARAGRAVDSTAAWGEVLRFHGAAVVLVVLGVVAAATG